MELGSGEEHLRKGLLGAVGVFYTTTRGMRGEVSSVILDLAVCGSGENCHRHLVTTRGANQRGKART